MTAHVFIQLCVLPTAFIVTLLALRIGIWIVEIRNGGSEVRSSTEEVLFMIFSLLMLLILAFAMGLGMVSLLQTTRPPETLPSRLWSGLAVYSIVGGLLSLVAWKAAADLRAYVRKQPINP